VRYLFDTNVFLYYLSADARIRRLFSEQFLSENEVVTSAIVRIELLSFSQLSHAQESALRDLLDQFRVIPITNDIEELAIDIRRKYRMKIPDAIIAATAYSTLSIVVTHNVKDFKRITGIRVYDPFEQQPS
jgi:predicted nucleic acid-binding protein